MTAGRHPVSQTKHWCTPQKYVDAVTEVFDGQIDLDPCSNEYSTVNARVEYILPENDGLRDSWDYDRIYVNPPYGRDVEHGTTIADWFVRIADAVGRGSEVMALVPVATNTAHWKDFVYPVASAICFLYDTRLHFVINGNEDTKGAPMSCCMIYYGDNPRKFGRVFSRYGAVVFLDDAMMPRTRNGKIISENTLF
ncbi:DNA N-6-adenine-methyltransferase [Bifidobacterium biavatii]|uniref:N-6-adenine-methyltransferase n=1 Tax=Bifidobacterium biavatii DSM 23969 TaxID=1437608 RepID=A0A087A4M6_9BIFI|nr:DNA N-6-adenine-methyltransferase [Bifidobacterium biavatii]KFI53726.1 N-6-adenine-methyltransferase [Bifidobacterium biavatii DSM 23969]